MCRTLLLERDILAKNAEFASGNRQLFAERGVFVLNLVSSPGSGKTLLLARTVQVLRDEFPVAVIGGDQQTAHDAERIHAAGAPAVQINTGKGCHLDAHGVGHALEQLPLPESGVLFIENVGNLVCPADFDLGEAYKVVILPLPGGDRAAREPWRLAVAALHLLRRDGEISHRFGPRAAFIQQMLERRLHTPETSGAGRLFDAAAALLGVRKFNDYEGQAAMELEALAHQYGPAAPLAEGFRLGDDGVLDLLPLLDRLADGMEPGAGAACFHATLALALSAWLKRAGANRGIHWVALSGGCFLNRLLASQLRARLETAGWQVFAARQAPPNDGGLSLGQAWVAMQAEVPAFDFRRARS